MPLIPPRAPRERRSVRGAAIALVAMSCMFSARDARGYSSYSVRFFGTGGGTERDRIKVRIDPPAPADVGAGDFTIELWMRGTLAGNVTPTTGYRPDGQTESQGIDWINGNILVDRDLDGGGPDWGISIHRDGPNDDRGVLRFGSEAGNGMQHTLQGRVHVLDGAWHHVALVRERGTGMKRIYVDGVLDVASATGASTEDLSYPDNRNTGAPASDPFLVFAAEKHGELGTGAYPSFAGWLDEIRVWGVARTQAEIAAARTEALPANTPGLVLYLRLEEGSGQTLVDVTGGNTATLYSGTAGAGEWSAEIPPGGAPTTTSTSPTSSTTTTSSSSSSSSVTTTSTSTSTSSTSMTPPDPTTSSTTSSSSSTSSTSSTTSTSIPPPTTSTTVSASTTTTTTVAGLVAAYGFEEATGTTTLDASGNGHTGTLIAASRTDSGRFGRALQLSGSGSWVTIADSAALDAGPELTLEAWVRPTTVSGYRMILDKTTTGQPSNYYLGLVEGAVEFGFLGSAGWRDHRANGLGAAVNAWTHVAAVYSDALNGVRIYVNGVEVLSQSESSSLVANAEQLRLGVGFSNEVFAGSLDEVRIYRRALTGAEIAADMNRPVSGPPGSTTTTSSTSTSTSTSSSNSLPGPPSTTSTSSSSTSSTSTSSSSSSSSSATSTSTTTSSSVTTTLPAGLVAAYGFEEGAGTTAADASGAGNTATLAGAAWTAAGRYGRAIALDGATAFVAASDSVLLDAGGELSLEAWVNPTSVDGYRMVIDKATGGDESNYYLAIVDGEVEFGFLDGGPARTWRNHSSAGAGLRTGEWRHLAAVYRDDLDSVVLYVDGVAVLAATEPRSLVPNSYQLRIGIGFPEEAFAGRIDEVRVYRRALTTADVRADMMTPIVP